MKKILKKIARSHGFTFNSQEMSAYGLSEGILYDIEIVEDKEAEEILHRKPSKTNRKVQDGLK